MKRVVVLIWLVVLGSSPIRAASPAESDALFDKGLYQEALKSYEPSLKSPDPETRLKAFYRSAECEVLLFRYAEAAKRVLAAEIPKDPLWRARFLILRAELGREFLKQYRGGTPDDEEEETGAGEKDLVRRTPKEWNEEIKSSFRKIYESRKELISIPLASEGYYIDLKNAELETAPTLWDFAVLRWADYLLADADEEERAKPPFLSLLGDEYEGRYSAEDSPVAQAAALYEESARMDGAGREAVRGLWRICRLLLPFERPGDFQPPPDHAAAVKAAISRLLQWKDSWSEPAAKAQAGLEAARKLNDSGEFARVVEVCRDIEKRWPKLRPAAHCARLRAQIELPVLNLSAKMVPPPGKDALRLNTRNLDKVFLRSYRIDPSELAGSLMGSRQDWSGLRHPSRELVAGRLAMAPDQAWTAATKAPAPFAYSDVPNSPPALESGIHLIVAASEPGLKPGKSLVSAVLLNVTDLFLIVSAGPQGPESDFILDPAGPSDRLVPGFHFYALDAMTGRPRPAAVVAFKSVNYGGTERVSLTLDDSGRGQEPVALRLAWRHHTNVSFDALARSGQSSAYGAHPVNLGHSVPAPIEVFLETDRPIYRPGQEVRGKVTVLRRLPRGYKAYDGSAPVVIQARDSNGQEFYKTSMMLGAMGSASVKFTIPTGRLLGGYNLNANLSDLGTHFGGYGTFSVEEYKRPEFEVEVKEASGPWKFGRSARVSGAVKYYFGGPVPDAPVRYKVHREVYIPWFCWWWRGLIPGGGRVEVLNAETKTDAEGKFSFVFTPQGAQRGRNDTVWPATFVVEAEARDPGGRTIAGERRFRAGEKAYLFEITPQSGFFSAAKAADVAVRLMNLNEQAVEGEANFELHRLEGKPSLPEERGHWGGHFPDNPSLESMFKDVADGPKVAEGKLSFKGEAPAKAVLGALPDGIYRFSVKTRDPWGGESEQKVIVLAVRSDGNRSSLALPMVAIPEHASYLPGETARFLIGSSLINGAMHVEIWGGNYLLERRMLDGGGTRVVSIPVTRDHKGGFTVRWFGAKDFKIRSGQARADVPWKDRELKVKLRHDKVLKPGQKATWSLSIFDQDKKAVAGEAVVRIFDRSLEYYVKGAGFWLKSLYGPRGGAPHAAGSLFDPGVLQIPVTEGWIKEMLKLFYEAVREPVPPMLRLNKSRAYGRRYGPKMAMLRGEAMVAMSELNAPGAAGDEMRLEEATSSMMAREGDAAMAKSERADKKSKGAEPPVKVRSDFSETAYFEPHLKFEAGRGAFTFQAPEQLTSWKIQASAMTADVKRGTVEDTAVTRKDLMVRVEIPRFYREGDTGVVKAVVHNETETDLSGEVSLIVEEDGKQAAEKLGLTELTKTFTAKAHGLATIVWNLEAPRGQTSFKVRVVGRSGELTDAEERDLPILPSRQRLIETVLTALDGAVKTALKLPVFDEKDPTRIHESVHLEIDPQLALSVLNSLPYLIHYPHECTEQLLNRYVPLAITDAFYRKHPALAQAAAKVPKRDTITPAWDRNDPRRLTQLMETPWEEISKGRKSYWPVIDMLDPILVQAEIRDALNKLISYQNSDGSFPWFPGGRSDPYITLLVLSGFAEAQRYGVEVPMEPVRRALGYVNNEIPKRLKPEPGDLSFILYGAYVVTSFPKSLPEAGLGYRFAKAWVDFADKHAGAMTQLGKAYAAFVYRRLGEDAKSELYLDRAMDSAREDPITGVYWTPEKISWLWYNDTVETHAFLLRTLLALRPKDSHIPGMVQWLLFNRKGNEWKSTKATAAAIYSLLDVLKSRGALDKGDGYKIKWGPDVQTAQVGPYDWLEKPLRWGKLGADIGPGHGKASIEKDGPGLAFASLTWIYTTDRPAKASGPGLMEISRRFFSRRKEGDGYKLKPLASGATVSVGDQIEVQLKINTRSQFEYVHLKDPKFAGFEAEELLSGWKWDNLGRYEEPRDSLTNFFMDWIPHGEYILRYRVRPTTPGAYRLGSAVLQSMYAPEMAAHSDGFVLSVKE